MRHRFIVNSRFRRELGCPSVHCMPLSKKRRFPGGEEEVYYHFPNRTVTLAPPNPNLTLGFFSPAPSPRPTSFVSYCTSSPQPPPRTVQLLLLRVIHQLDHARASSGRRPPCPVGSRERPQDGLYVLPQHHDGGYVVGQARRFRSGFRR